MSGLSVDAGWVPVALASGLDRGTSAGTRIDGHEIVVWRDDAGASHVWEDRCPHRGMRLSFGFVRDNHLSCLYHGWRFDAAGRCRYIPAHPALDVPETITVTRYLCAEQAGLIWASAGAPEAGDGPPGEDLRTTAVRSITIRAPLAEILTALKLEALPDGDVPIDVVETGPLLRLDLDGESLILAVQRLSPLETCLHVALVGTEDGDMAVALPRISAWTESLRRRAEAACADRSPRVVLP